MKRFILIAAFATALPLAARAADDVYPSPDAIPHVLMSGLAHTDQMEPKYVSMMANMLRQSARETGTLTLEDIEAAEARQRREQSRQWLRDAMSYDQDFDLKVTEDEIRATFDDRRAQRQDDVPAAERRKMIGRQVAQILKRYDTDNDGVITSREAGTPPENDEDARHRGFANSRDLLSLDPNRDGQLTGQEVEMLARKAFRTVDKDRDGTISRDESRTITKALRTSQLKSSGCALPAAAAQDRVLMIHTIGGGAWSDVALGGEARETNVVTLDVENGAEPLYVVVSSLKPVIWRVTGAAERISRLVLAGPHRMHDIAYDEDNGVVVTPPKAPEIMAGVTGLAIDKVMYLKGDKSQGCLPFGMEIHLGSGGVRYLNARGSDEEPVIKTLLGRDADKRYEGYNPVSLTLGTDKISPVIPPENTAPTPEGLDAEVWKQALLLQPGGLVRLKDEAIVTEARPQVYNVLPGWAGLAQLTQQGVLKAEKISPPATRVIVTDGLTTVVVRNHGGGEVVKNSDARILVTDDWEFRLLKTVDVFPAGLEGAFATRFVLPKGISLRDVQRRGGSCFRLEDGAEAPKNTPLCK